MRKSLGLIAGGVNLALLCACMLGAGCQTPASGQGGGKRAAAERKRPALPPLVTALNRNGDRWLEADEVARAPASLRTLDTSGDGRLTKEEFWKAREAGAAVQQSPEEDPAAPHEGAVAARERGQAGAGRGGKSRALPRLLTALDPNGDFVIDADEIDRAAAALEALDADGDRRLSPEELGLKAANKN